MKRSTNNKRIQFTAQHRSTLSYRIFTWIENEPTASCRKIRDKHVVIITHLEIWNLLVYWILCRTSPHPGSRDDGSWEQLAEMKPDRLMCKHTHGWGECYADDEQTHVKCVAVACLGSKTFNGLHPLVLESLLAVAHLCFVRFNNSQSVKCFYFCAAMLLYMWKMRLMMFALVSLFVVVCFTFTGCVTTDRRFAPVPPSYSQTHTAAAAAAAPCTALSAAWTGAEQAAWTPGSSLVHSPVGDASWWENIIREKRKICWRAGNIVSIKSPCVQLYYSINAVRETCHHSRYDVGKQ